jgi:hypothetical protein
MDMIVVQNLLVLALFAVVLVGLVRYIINECARPSDVSAYVANRRLNKVTTISLVLSIAFFTTVIDLFFK